MDVVSPVCWHLLHVIPAFETGLGRPAIKANLSYIRLWDPHGGRREATSTCILRRVRLYGSTCTKKYMQMKDNRKNWLAYCTSDHALAPVCILYISG